MVELETIAASAGTFTTHEVALWMAKAGDDGVNWSLQHLMYDDVEEDKIMVTSVKTAYNLGDGVVVPKRDKDDAELDEVDLAIRQYEKAK